MAEECIDAHHHLWSYIPEDYPWIRENMDVLRGDYLLPQLETAAQSVGVTGTVVVQACQTMQETDWLASLAGKSSLIRGVVGWAPLIDPNVMQSLEQIAELPKIKGLRHVLQDEPDPFYMLREDFQHGISLLEHFNLRYDLLIFESHLPQTIELVDQHPKQIFVVDHIAKPQIRELTISPWRENLKLLAQRENVYCKVSGMVTEAPWDSWTEDVLAPYFEVAFEAFGPRRTMFGSDWPVLTLASSYERWMDAVRGALKRFSEMERKRVLSETAIEVYGL